MTLLSTKRHSLAHVMAQAVKQLYPEAKIATGPDTEDGFYYDFDFGTTEFSDKDLKEVEKTMKKIITQNQDFRKFEVSIGEARKILNEMGEGFKNELVDKIEAGDMKKPHPNPLLKGEGINGKPISFYLNISKGAKETDMQIFLTKEGVFPVELDGDQVKNLKFIDMCTGPHVENTKELDANSFKLVRVAGAYWLGNSDNQQLTRIYAYAFDNKEDLDKHVNMIEEAKKRDHRIIGAKLKLFTISDLVGPGLPLLQPAGMIIRQSIENYLWELHSQRGYQKVWTPHLAKEALYETSGHAGHYLDDMFKVYGGTSKETFFLKPMNCPHHMQLFADNQFSYRDMPVRYFEPATIYRDEKSGQLSGLTRVRAITQDDGHLFCRVSQIKDEVKTITDIIKEYYNTLGMTDDYWVSLSVRGEDRTKYLGGDDVWELAEGALEQAAKENKLPYKRVEGEAAFYGPKLDFMFKDAIGREWQLATIQCDFNLPVRFDLSFTNENNEKERPVVIHRAISGSFERGMGVLIEHFAGVFPLWMSPRQVIIVPVLPKFDDYAQSVLDTLKTAGIRASADFSTDGLNKKVRNAEKMHNNYILVIGEQEENDKTVSVRNYKTKEQTVEGLEEFKTRILTEINTRRL
ncbi:MAG: threonine--tRNA ligase [Candidatus Gracilibacteria bacterium]|nr:threonine--tRNA ligase [Candidatus Gracilibacteria bacterium]